MLPSASNSCSRSQPVSSDKRLGRLARPDVVVVEASSATRASAVELPAKRSSSASATRRRAPQIDVARAVDRDVPLVLRQRRIGPGMHTEHARQPHRDLVRQLVGGMRVCGQHLLTALVAFEYRRDVIGREVVVHALRPTRSLRPAERAAALGTRPSGSARSCARISSAWRWMKMCVESKPFSQPMRQFASTSRRTPRTARPGSRKPGGTSSCERRQGPSGRRRRRTRGRCTSCTGSRGRLRPIARLSGAPTISQSSPSRNGT